MKKHVPTGAFGKVTRCPAHPELYVRCDVVSTRFAKDRVRSPYTARIAK